MPTQPTRWTQTGNRILKDICEHALSCSWKACQERNYELRFGIHQGTQAGPLTRGHLTTHKDLNNIKHQYNIDCVKKGSDDATSVAHWVQEMRQENYNPVLY